MNQGAAAASAQHRRAGRDRVSLFELDALPALAFPTANHPGAETVGDV